MGWLVRRCRVHLGINSITWRCLSTLKEQKSTSSKRVRQHVNPLASIYQEPLVIPEWSQHFINPNLPIHLDIGCARGKYLHTIAADAKTMNFIGIEIRHSVVQEAITRAKELGLLNVAFIHGNMNVHAASLIQSLPSPIQSVSIFHPDPWMKKRHIKRRLVTEAFVTELATFLSPHTPIYLQTDVSELMDYMIDIFAASHRYSIETLEKNPFGTCTDRESFVLKQGGAIYRALVMVNPSK